MTISNYSKVLALKTHSKTAIYIVLILGVLTFTFATFAKDDRYHTLPGGINGHISMLSIAISDLNYGLTGYFYYWKVNRALHEGINWKELRGASKSVSINKPLDPELWNKAIQKALHVENVTSEGTHALIREDKGLADYYKLAFRIFGYKIESFFYFYFLLLSVSVLIFLFTCYKQTNLLNILLIYLCSHFVVVALAPKIGFQLQTIHNDRFIPALSILPMLYLSQLILRNQKLTPVTLIGAGIQIWILMLAIHIRSSAIYQLLFICAIVVLAILWNWIKTSKAGRYTFNKIRFWPLGLLFLGFFFLKLHLLLGLHPSYNDVTAYHLFWHPAYEGLGAHPDSWDKYRIAYGDEASFHFVERRLREKTGSPWTDRAGYEIFESILKEEYFRILKEDPRFVIENYLYKLILFFKVYFSSSFKILNSSSLGAIDHLLKLELLCAIALGSLLAGKSYLKRWLKYLYILLLGLSFSLLPGIFAMPTPFLIIDPALVLTFIIYFVISGGICWGVQMVASKV